MEIKKKTWPELFEKISRGEKNADFRLADFEVHNGDTLIFEEYDPAKKEYTGKSLQKTVKRVNKIYPLEFWDKKELEKQGAYLLEFGE